VAKLTRAELTPSIFDKPFSTLAAQAAQLIPLIFIPTLADLGSLCVSGTERAASFSAIAAQPLLCF
jgi:hypothetical protein